MAAIAGMAFVAIHDGQRETVIVWQCLVAFQTCIGLVNGVSQSASIHLGVYVPHGVGAGHGVAQPTLPEPGCARHLQRVEASQPRPNRIMEALATVAVEMRGSGLRSVMGPISKAERWNTLSEYAIRRRSNSGLPLLQASPFQFGNFLNETLHFLVVRNGLTHTLAPDLGDANLAQHAGMTLHQVDGLVQLAVGAMAVAVGLAALAGTLGESAAKQPLAGGQLGNAGTEAAFGSGEFGAVEWLGHNLYQYNIQDIDEKQARNRNANLLSSRAKGKTAMKPDALAR